MLEAEFAFSDGLLILIDNVIIINDAIFVLGISFSFVAVADQHEFMRFGLPDGRQGNLKVSNLVLLSDGILDFNNGHLFICWILSEAEVAEFNFSFVLVLPPSNHGVIISFLDGELVSPLIVNTDKFSSRLAGLWGQGIIVSIICQSESGVIEAAFLHNGEESCIVEGLDGHLGDVFEEILMVDGPNLLLLEVNDVDLTFGDVENDDLFFVELSEEVDDVLIGV